MAFRRRISNVAHGLQDVRNALESSFATNARAGNSDIEPPVYWRNSVAANGRTGEGWAGQEKLIHRGKF